MKRPKRALFAACAIAALIAATAAVPAPFNAQWIANYLRFAPHHNLTPLQPQSTSAAKILAGAKAQIGTRYDASYQTIAYPMGDVAASKGACTDVVIRALRSAGFDLQQRIHDDMSAHFKEYPNDWDLAAPNTNIDHRRVPNQMVYLAKYGRELARETTGDALQSWQVGDIVYWNTGNVGNTRLHTGIISDTRDWRGLPHVIHNGSVCIEDDALDRWPIIGHFRFPK